MFTESVDSELVIEEKSSASRKLIAGLLAIGVTGAVFLGYVYFRNRHARESAAAAAAKAGPAIAPLGPPKAHILLDEALLKGGQTIIGGTVKNISQETLFGLAVDLELKRRNSRSIEKMRVAVNPSQLAPNDEGQYALKLPAQNFSSVKLVALSGADSALLAFSSAPGQKRPLERLEPRTVVVPRTSTSRDEFLNTPDKPARVP
jgi:hypothetical protein